MAAQASANARRRVGLSKDRVLRAAIQIADKSGIEALTMRKLAQKLGVEAMTLYYYMTRKDDIVDGILDLVVGEIDVPSEGGDWKAALRRSAISAHEVLLRHPWACSLMMAPARVRPGRLRYMESLLKRLREAGFSAEMTHHAYHALDSHILGFTMWEVGYSTGIRELPDSGAALRRELTLDAYPYLVEHMGEHVAASKGNDGESEFEFGLDLILDGLEEIRVTPARRAHAATASRSRGKRAATA
jgi:AcrR family transcriptional regulator